MHARRYCARAWWNVRRVGDTGASITSSPSNCPDAGGAERSILLTSLSVLSPVLPALLSSLLRLLPSLLLLSSLLSTVLLPSLLLSVLLSTLLRRLCNLLVSLRRSPGGSKREQCPALASEAVSRCGGGASYAALAGASLATINNASVQTLMLPVVKSRLHMEEQFARLYATIRNKFGEA